MVCASSSSHGKHQALVQFGTNVHSCKRATDGNDTANLKPQFNQLNRCENILLVGIAITNSKPGYVRGCSPKGSLPNDGWLCKSSGNNIITYGRIFIYRLYVPCMCTHHIAVCQEIEIKTKLG